MSIEVFKDGKSELCEPHQLHSYMLDGYSLTNDPVVVEPTREELEQQANELGIEFDEKTRDSTLAKRIDEKLKA